MMDLETIDIYLVIDLLVLFLIGMGPKIALVPFIEITGGISADVQRQVARKMIQTAFGTALVLLILGKLLMTLLHFTTGALSVAGGIVLLVLALVMALSPNEPEDRRDEVQGRDAMQMALYPLAVPYLLNPVGIVALVTLSGEASTLAQYAVVIAVLLLIVGFDWLVFSNVNRLSKYLDPSRMIVTEKVFGILLAALAIQLMLDGLAELGILNILAQ